MTIFLLEKQAAVIAIKRALYNAATVMVLFLRERQL